MTNTTAQSHTHSLSLVVPLVIALGLQALGGLLIPWLYRDSLWVATALRGSDITNLALVIPLLLGLRALVRRGSLRAQLAAAGVAFYVWENNLYYLAGCAFNQFFLVYVAVSVLSLIELVLTVIRIDPVGVAGNTTQTMPRRVIAIISLAMATVLSVLWLGQVTTSLITRRLPQMLIDAGGSTHLVAALDLTLLVPLYVIGAVLLWRAQSWGTIISGAMLVQATLVTVGLTLTSPVQAAAGVKGAWTMLPLWGAMGICFLIAAILLFRNITKTPSLNETRSGVPAVQSLARHQLNAGTR